MDAEFLDALRAPKVRYIKLGVGGSWEAASLDGGTLEWGTDADPKLDSDTADWAAVRAQYLAGGSSPGSASDAVRELRDSYTLGSDTLWITFARDHMWWTFADPVIVHRDHPAAGEGASYRRSIGGWRNTDLQGQPLPMHRLSTRLTQLSAYRRTICAVAAADYALRRIKGEDDPLVAAARVARDTLECALAALIPQLHWADFELFVDLLVTNGGWRRVSALGGSMKDIDLVVEQPLTGERASIQVKSKANQAALDRCAAAFAVSPLSNRLIFVCHSPQSALEPPTARGRKIEVWTAPRLAAMAVLGAWLIERAG